jgi:diguanylate cyclase (GGDEF)-like protein
VSALSEHQLRGRAFLLGSDARSVDVEVQQISQHTWRLVAMAGDLSPVTAHLLVGHHGALLADPGSVVTWPEMLGAMASVREALDVRWVFGHSAAPAVIGALPLVETTLGSQVHVVTSPELFPMVSHYGTRLPVDVLRRGQMLDIGGRRLVSDHGDEGTSRFVLHDEQTGLMLGAGPEELSAAPLPLRLEEVRRSLEDVLLTTLAPIALEGRALAALGPVGRVTSLRTYVHDDGFWWELGGRDGLRGRALHAPPASGPATLRVELSEPQPIVIDLRFANDFAHLVDDPDLASLVESLHRPLVSSMRRVLAMREAVLAERRLRVDSRTDALTGVANRRALTAWECRTRFAALMIDLDHFKLINDAHGHSVGDEVLRAVANAIAHQIRGKDLVVRYGGDEFLVMLSGADYEVAGMVAERIRRAVARLRVQPGEPDGGVTLSIGVASGMGRSDEVTKLADKALYVAKADGRNAVRFA